MKYKYVWQFLAIIVVLTILVSVIIKTTDLEKLRDQLLAFPVWLFLCLLAITTLQSVLKGYRFWLILHLSQINITLLRTVRLFIASQLTSSLIGGELLRGYFVRLETPAPASAITGSILTQGLVELFGAAALLLFASFWYEDFISFGIMGVLFLIGTYIIITHRHILLTITQPMKKWSLIKKMLPTILQSQTVIRHTVVGVHQSYPDKKRIYIFILALATHVLGALILYVVISGFGVTPHILPTLITSSGSTIIQTLASVIPGGLGVTEGGTASMLVGFGINWEKALGIILIYRAATFLFPIILGFAFTIIFYSKKIINS